MQRGVTQDAAAAAQQVIENRPQDAARGARRAAQAAGAGLSFSRFFTLSGRDPFDEVAWDTRSALITNEKGEVVFEQTASRGPDVLVAAGHQHRGVEVLPRPAPPQAGRGA